MATELQVVVEGAARLRKPYSPPSPSPSSSSCLFPAPGDLMADVSAGVSGPDVNVRMDRWKRGLCGAERSENEPGT